MVGYSFTNGIGIGYMDLKPRKKPCLVIQRDNIVVKVATFNDYESVRYFLDSLADAFNMEKWDWSGDDIPEKLRIGKGHGDDD